MLDRRIMDMTENFLDRCKTAFPGIEEGDHVADKLLQSVGELNADMSKNRSSIANDLGFPPSGSIIIDHAKAARACTDAYQKADTDNFIKSTVESAPMLMARAIARGEESTSVLSLGKGREVFRDISWEAPKLNPTQKEIFDGINKNPALKADVVADPQDKKNFQIVVSLKPKG